MFIVTGICSLISFTAPLPSYAGNMRTEFVVSTTGSDSNPGTLDKPFASLEKARNAVRDLKQKGGLPAGGVAVLVRGGTYSLSKSFRLNQLDSGSEIAPIVYRSYKNEEVHLIGGRQLSGFAPVTNPAILKRLDASARGKVVQIDLKASGITDFGNLAVRGFGKPQNPSGLQLYFNGRPMTLARWPNSGWAKIAATPAGPNGGRFQYDGDRPARWSNDDEIWLHGYWTWDWADSYTKVTSIDPRSRQIVTQSPHGVYGYKAGARYYALNILEELDAPGEWYLDRKSGILYFWPPESLATGKAFVSILPGIVSLDGTSFVIIQGMTIEYCRGTAVTVTGGRNNRVAGCVVRNVGNDAVTISGGSNNGVVGSDIYNCGESGVLLSGGDRKTLAPAGNFAVNNRIHDYSQWVRTYIPGVSVSGVGNRVANNLIYNAPHQAILLHGNDHLIEYNEIHHVLLETSDSGAFYMGRDYSERGNTIRYNYFHDLSMGDVQAIYLDDFGSGVLVYGNVVYKAGRGVKIGGGHDNTVKNNLFVGTKEGVSVDARGTNWAKKYFDGTDTTLLDRLKSVNYKQPPYSTRYPNLSTLYDGNPALPEGNYIVNNICVGGSWLGLKDATNRLVKIEANLVTSNPGFVDLAHQNFQLVDGSSAFQLGFQRVPLEHIGLYLDEFRKPLPAAANR